MYARSPYRIDWNVNIVLAVACSQFFFFLFTVNLVLTAAHTQPKCDVSHRCYAKPLSLCILYALCLRVFRLLIRLMPSTISVSDSNGWQTVPHTAFSHHTAGRAKLSIKTKPTKRAHFRYFVQKVSAGVKWISVWIKFNSIILTVNQDLSEKDLRSCSEKYSKSKQTSKIHTNTFGHINHLAKPNRCSVKCDCQFGIPDRHPSAAALSCCQTNNPIINQAHQSKIEEEKSAHILDLEIQWFSHTCEMNNQKQWSLIEIADDCCSILTFVK